MSNKPVTKTQEWRALAEHRQAMEGTHVRDLFTADPARFDRYHVTARARDSEILLDFSRHRITEETLARLMDLARARNVEAQRDALFSGQAVNVTEGRPALHTALRGMEKDLRVNGESVGDFVRETLARIEAISAEIRGDERWTDVVNIGIGGSHLGPHLVCDALAAGEDGPRVHFLANIDGAAFESVTRGLDPRHTLFIIASKTFTTLETRMNAESARQWLAAHGIASPAAHFVAVTANAAAAADFGIAAARTLPLRDWIGGRYSLWSAIGLVIAVTLGFEKFQDLLRGAAAMDDHFRRTPLEKNMPVMMALLGLWCRNFWDMRAHAVVPYAQALRLLPTYVQQLDMESNGKSVDAAGRPLTAASGPVVFGDTGTNAQHAFFQHLHQGTDITPVDFILIATPAHPHAAHHRQLNANALAQAKALMEGLENRAAPHQSFPGNRPSSVLLLRRLDAFHLGMLLALYEHKVFAQGALWGINSFDQWGVELGKTLARTIAAGLEAGATDPALDSATRGLMARLMKA